MCRVCRVQTYVGWDEVSNGQYRWKQKMCRGCGAVLEFTQPVPVVQMEQEPTFHDHTPREQRMPKKDRDDYYSKW